MTAKARRALVALPDEVLLPGEVRTVHLAAGSVPGAAVREGRRLLVAPALPGAHGEPGRPASIATLARVQERERLPSGDLRLVLAGVCRARLTRLRRLQHGWSADARELRERSPLEEDRRLELDRQRSLFQALATAGGEPVLDPLELLLGGEDDEPHLSERLAAHVPLERAERIELLLELDPLERLRHLRRALERELARVEAATSSATQKEAASNPLGLDRLELERFERRLSATGLNEPARRIVRRELDHLRQISAHSPEAARIRNYVEWTLELPWGGAPAPTSRGFKKVSAALDAGHVGLAEVKQRVAEYLAVRLLGGGARGTVLCFAGPPGTGKSSMGRAVAAALNRPYLSIPVGATVHERELVGVSHRRLGATPGAILAGIHRCGADDPIILLDEIDKVSLGGEGTAAGPLLHLLDPEHNAEFLDHFLGVPFDLSRCLFLATANDVDDIPEGLLDRMEIIDFEGYTESEKFAIATKHLVPRALRHAGIEKRQLRISPAAMRAIIHGWTEEAGVRQLQRSLISLARKAAVAVVKGEDGLSVRKRDLVELLGPRTVNEDLCLRRPVVGVTTGLAWTSAGGALLPIEALAMPGAGRIVLTGSIGEVMRESVQTAVSYVRTCFGSLGIEHDLIDRIDLHLHFPSAATPKDGPSAGIAIAAALVSLLTGRAARHDIAMTGELSLLGTVLPVGGLREKLLAAIRSRFARVIVPARNAEDIGRIAPEIRQAVEVLLVDDVQEVFELGLLERGGKQRGPAAPTRSLRRVARRARERDGDG